jgi:hypothetical protein
MRIAALLTAAVAGACALPGLAVADTTIYAPGYPAPYTGPNTVTVSVPVTATVASACGFATAPNGSFTHADFNVTGIPGDIVPFQLDCSVAFRIAVSSQNGGMLGPASPAPPTGYINLADYNVALTIVTNSNGTLNINCNASQLLAAGQGCDTANTNGFRGTASNTEGYRSAGASTNQTGSQIVLTRAAQPANPVLVSGAYQDILTVTLSPSP